MPYSYLEDIAISDVAFEASARTLEGLFIEASEALTGVMVEELSAITEEKELVFEVENPAVDMLLYNFLNEIIYYKDAKRLLLRVKEVSIEKSRSGFRLKASAYGQTIDPNRHALSTDVKAVTLHRFAVEQTDDGWRSVVVLDV